MTSRSRDTRAHVRGLLLAAVVAVLLTLFGAGAASAATAPTAQTRVGASTPAVAFVVGPGGGIGAGQRLGIDRPTYDFVLATGVAAKSAPLLNKAGRTYPSVIDPCTGGAISHPGSGLSKVPVGDRVSWGAKERGGYIKQWYDRGHTTPEGGWGGYDIHHIQPREYGGSNDFDNLVRSFETSISSSSTRGGEATDMSSVENTLNRFREWQTPRDGIGDNPFTLGCSLDDPARVDEISDAWRGQDVPGELVELWSTSRESRLFEDVDYGQWGLHLLSPSMCGSRTAVERLARPGEYRADDVIVGEFLGDQELLLLCPSEVGQRRVLVALPLDQRSEWHAAGTGLADLLSGYLDHMGDKFWEGRQEP